MRSLAVLLLVSGCALAPSVHPLTASEPAPAGNELTAAQQGSPAPLGSATGNASASTQTQRSTFAHAKRDVLLRRACELGSGGACNDLGLAEKDSKAAQPWFERSCQLKLVRGCTNLATVLTELQSDGPRAVELLTQACDQEDEVACNRLGDEAYSGGAMAKNPARAAAAYDKACKLGLVASCVSSAWLFSNGEGVIKNRERARELFEFSCQRDDASGCAGLAASLVHDARSDADLTRGMEVGRKACVAHIGVGCYWAAWAIARLHGKTDDEASALMKQACQLRVDAACELLGQPDGDSGHAN